MSIKTVSRLILKIIIDYAIEIGSFERIVISYEEIAKKIQIENMNFFMVCVKYLYNKKYLVFLSKENDDTRLINLTAEGIDFFEG